MWTFGVPSFKGVRGMIISVMSYSLVFGVVGMRNNSNDIFYYL